MKSIIFLATVVLMMSLPAGAVTGKCETPLAWSVGSIARVFNVSPDDVKKAANDATKLWEDAVTKNLFNYDRQSNFKVSLFDDGSQQRLQSILRKRELSEVSSNRVKKSKQALDRKKRAFEANSETYKENKEALNRAMEAYNNEVAVVNSQGGASENKAEELEQRKEKLDSARQKLNRQVDKLNSESRALQNAVAKFNALVSKHNRALSLIPTLDASRAGRFIYERRSSTLGAPSEFRKIEVYRFANQKHLVWVLAHEFGHALGLEHPGVENSVMSAVSDIENTYDGPIQLSKTDKDLITSACGL